MSECLVSSSFKRICGAVGIHGSKSITHRALLVAAMAEGVSVLDNVLFSCDTMYMQEALSLLGVRFELDEAHSKIRVFGQSGVVAAENAHVYLGNAATALRFLLSFVALGCGQFILTGDSRMQERPVGSLVKALCDLGVRVEYLGAEGYPPVCVYACGVRGASVDISARVSSQYVSSLLLCAPYFLNGLCLRVNDAIASKPYVSLTKQLMHDFGGACFQKSESEFIVPRGSYKGREYVVEGDASNALYFFAMAAVTGGAVRVAPLNPQSAQGDIAFVDVLKTMGCCVEKDSGSIQVSGYARYAVDVDLNEMPDCVPLLAVLALFVRGVTVIRNVAHLRLKESDRLAALATELSKLGAVVSEGCDSLSVRPAQDYRAVELFTYNDHRLVMAFSIAALRIPRLRVSPLSPVAKSFPHYFEIFHRLCAS